MFLLNFIKFYGDLKTSQLIRFLSVRIALGHFIKT